MIEIGVRELKKGVSRVLRQVASGEGIRVTRRGEPIAEIIPVSAQSPDRRLKSLTAAGQLTPASAARSAHPPELATSTVSASGLVLDDRADER